MRWSSRIRVQLRVWVVRGETGLSAVLRAVFMLLIVLLSHYESHYKS
ncbi:hypothetical protein ACIPC1_35970 [Streptomyces sp. NPDC087263]